MSNNNSLQYIDNVSLIIDPITALILRSAFGTHVELDKTI